MRAATAAVLFARVLGVAAAHAEEVAPPTPSAETKPPAVTASQPPRGKAKKTTQPTNRAMQEETGEFANFGQWKEVASFIDSMVAKHGFEKSALETLFSKVHYVDKAIQLIKPAPAGKPKNWQAYRNRFVEPVRIESGVRFWNDYQEALARAETEFGVPAEIIVGIIGVETVYGRNTGNFRVVDAITTLAFDYPNTPNRDARMTFFREELENTLLFARESSVDPLSLLGSYAGAIGWPQFMPGTIRRFALDYDGNGSINLRNSPVDAIGSVANYLARHGWNRGEPIVFPVRVDTAADGSSPWTPLLERGLEATLTTAELANAGIRQTVELPANMKFGLIDLQNGFEPTEYWVGGPNFFAITQYNRSYFYAMSVVDLGKAIRTARSR